MMTESSIVKHAPSGKNNIDKPIKTASVPERGKKALLAGVMALSCMLPVKANAAAADNTQIGKTVVEMTPQDSGKYSQLYDKMTRQRLHTYREISENLVDKENTVPKPGALTAQEKQTLAELHEKYPHAQQKLIEETAERVKMYKKIADDLAR